MVFKRLSLSTLIFACFVIYVSAVKDITLTAIASAPFGFPSKALTVVLAQQPAADVTVSLSSTVAGVYPSTLLFSQYNWNTARTVVVDLSQADNGIIGQQFNVTASAASSDSGYNSLSRFLAFTAARSMNVLPVSPTDNTVRPALYILSDGKNTNCTVALTSAPSATVTVTAVSSDTAKFTVSPATLSFTTTNWATAQTVTLTAVTQYDANVIPTLTLTPTNGGYTGVAAVVYNVRVQPVVLNYGNLLNIAQNGAAAVVPIQVARKPTANTTLTFTPAANAPFSVVQPTAVVISNLDNWNSTDFTVSLAPSCASAAAGVGGSPCSDPSTSVAVTYTSTDALYSGRSQDFAVAVNPGAGVAAAMTNVKIRKSYAQFMVVTLQGPPAPTSAVVLSTSILSGSSNIQISPSSVTITPSTYLTAQTITVKGIANGNAAIAVGTSSSDANFDAQTAVITNLVVSAASRSLASIMMMALPVVASLIGATIFF